MTNTNNSPHWKESDLIDRLYQLEPAQGPAVRHFDECPECAEAWAALVARRDGLLSAPVQVSDERLRVQRQAIWAGIEPPRRPLLWRAMPAVATALLLIVGVALHQSPAPRMQPVEVAAVQTVSDSQLFTEIASVVNQESPRETDPIRGLFSDDATMEAQ